MDEAPGMHLAHSGAQPDSDRQELAQLHRGAHNAVEGVSARVFEYEPGLSVMPGQADRLQGPRAVELLCELELALEPSGTGPSQGVFGRREKENRCGRRE